MRLRLTVLIGLLILLALVARIGAVQPRPVGKVEYLVISVPPSPSELEKELNRRGGQGWMFITSVRTALGEALVLKHESTEAR